MKKILLFLLYAFPLFCFSQRKVEDFFNNRIDFVLDNDNGREFMGGIVTEYIKTDSLNNFYSKTGIQPFYKYVESNYFDKKFLEPRNLAFENDRNWEYNNYYKTNTSGGSNEYELKLYPYRNFSIKSVGRLMFQGHPSRGRISYYENFENFELSMSKRGGNKIKINIYKTFYSNVNIAVYGISLFEKNSISNMNFFNTLTIKFNNSDKCITFFITIYETIGMDGPYQEGNHYYLGSYPNIIMRKVEITGNKEEAIKYLKKNKLDYIEIATQDYKEENFRKKDN